jgi:hypothetical protein
MRFLTGLLLIASAIGINTGYLFAQGGWTPEVRIASHNDTYDEQIIAKGDSLHVVYWGDSFESFYISSSDNGDSWSQPLLLGDSLVSDNSTGPSILSIGDTLITIWSCIMLSNLKGNIGFRKSTDNGISWNGQTYILSRNIDSFGHTVFCNNGSNIFVIFNYYEDTLRFAFTASTNLGRTWTTPTVICQTRESGRFDTSCRGDTIHIIWSGRYSFDYRWETYYLKSNNGGNTWTQSVNLSTIDDRGSADPVMAINGEGTIAACWIDAKYSPNPWNGDVFLRFSYDGGETWSIEKQITYSHWAIGPRLIWSGDSLHVVWEDDRAGQMDIYYILSSDGGCTWGEEERIDSNEARSSTPDIAISGQYRYIVWGDWRTDLGHGVYFTRWDPGSDIKEEPNGNLFTTSNLSTYPNPFNNSTVIECLNLKGGSIEIYNPLGQLLKSIPIQKEADKIKWDATDAEGNKVSSGIYFARAKASQYSNLLKLIYIK